jgi:SAM-dependent methyltransferase
MSLAVQLRGAWRALAKDFRRQTGKRQDTQLYFDPNFADLLETWAVDNAWREIRFLLRDRHGSVLDLACGTGRAYDFLKDFERLEYHGCDLSQPLIERAAARGIAPDRLAVGDATKLEYEDDAFDYVFSIGSLEHFSQTGLRQAISECRRVCRGINFHQVPVSLSDFDEGWITPYQSYWNNSERWWLAQFESVFDSDVWVMSSKWNDDKSRGAWFICTAS